MEPLVEEIAAKFKSTDANTFVSSVDRLKALREEGCNSAARNKLCRILQELLAYESGALVRSVIQKVMQRVPIWKDRNGYAFRLYASVVLAELTESTSIARFSGQEAIRACAFARALLEQHAFLLHMADVAQKKVGAWHQFIGIALEVTKCFVNLSRSSKKFRLSLQEVDSFFPTVLNLASARSVKLMDLQEIRQVKLALIHLLNTFSVFEDSKTWALDNGILPIAAAFARLSLADPDCEAESKLNSAVPMAYQAMEEALKDPKTQDSVMMGIRISLEENYSLRKSMGRPLPRAPQLTWARGLQAKQLLYGQRVNGKPQWCALGGCVRLGLNWRHADGSASAGAAPLHSIAAKITRSYIGRLTENTARRASNQPPPERERRYYSGTRKRILLSFIGRVATSTQNETTMRLVECLCSLLAGPNWSIPLP